MIMVEDFIQELAYAVLLMTVLAHRIAIAALRARAYVPRPAAAEGDVLLAVVQMPRRGGVRMVLLGRGAVVARHVGGAAAAG